MYIPNTKHETLHKTHTTDHCYKLQVTQIVATVATTWLALS